MFSEDLNKKIEVLSEREKKEEQQKLKEELKTILDELTYAKIAEIQAQEAEHINQALTKMPMHMTMG